MTPRWAALGLALLSCNGILGIEEPILATDSAGGGGGNGGTTAGGSAGASSKAGSGGTADGGGGGGSGGESGASGGEGGGPADPCGNGEVDTSEQCDDANENPNDECTTECQRALCGDGFVRVFLEECDDGNTDDLDGCSSACVVEDRVRRRVLHEP